MSRMSCLPWMFEQLLPWLCRKEAGVRPHGRVILLEVLEVSSECGQEGAGDC